MRLLFICTVLLLAACNLEYYAEEDECEFPDYSDCNTVEPFFGQMQINTSKNEEYTLNYVTLYEGFIEENNVFCEFKLSASDTIIDVPLDRQFSAKAVYVFNNDTIATIDGTYVKKQDREYCDSVCWSVSGLELDLRLK